MQDDALTVIVCGSSAAISLPAYLTALRHEVDLPLRVLLTASAERFIQPQVVAWYADEAWTSSDARLNPAELGRRSLGLVVLPATANMLAAAALGLAATPAQTAVLACPRPALFFPSLSSSMWAKRPVREHVAALRADGHQVVDPEQREVFELWRREVSVGPALLAPEHATEAIIKWLDDGLAEAAGQDEQAP